MHKVHYSQAFAYPFILHAQYSLYDLRNVCIPQVKVLIWTASPNPTYHPKKSIFFIVTHYNKHYKNAFLRTRGLHWTFTFLVRCTFNQSLLNSIALHDNTVCRNCFSDASGAWFEFLYVCGNLSGVALLWMPPYVWWWGGWVGGVVRVVGGVVCGVWDV